MSGLSGDRVLWLCLGGGVNRGKACSLNVLIQTGISLFFAARGILHDLRQVVDLTEIKHAEKEDKIIGEGTEDGTYALDQFCNSILTCYSPQTRYTSETIRKHKP